MTTLVWPTLHSKSTMPRVGNTLSPAPFRTGMPTDFVTVNNLIIRQPPLCNDVACGSTVHKPSPTGVTYAYWLKFLKQIDFVNTMRLILSYWPLISRSSGLTIFHAHGNLLMNLLDRSSSTWISFWLWVIFTLVFLFIFVIILLVIWFFLSINSSKLVCFSSSFHLSSTFSPTLTSSTRLGRLSFGFWFSRWLPFRMLLPAIFCQMTLLATMAALLGFWTILCQMALLSTVVARLILDVWLAYRLCHMSPWTLVLI